MCRILVFLLVFPAYANTGKQLYTNNCIRCHNSNPSKPGTVGPELKTTPNNVFYVKITQGKYPDGYTPKKRTRIMPKFKFTTQQVNEIVKHIKGN